MYGWSEGGGDARDGIRDMHALLALYVWVLVGCVCWLLGVDVCVVLFILIEFRFKPVTHTRCRSRGRHPLSTSALDCALIARRSRGYV